MERRNQTIAFVLSGIFGPTRSETKMEENDSEQPTSDLLRVGNESFAVVG